MLFGALGSDPSWRRLHLHCCWVYFFSRSGCPSCSGQGACSGKTGVWLFIMASCRSGQQRRLALWLPLVLLTGLLLRWRLLLLLRVFRLRGLLARLLRLVHLVLLVVVLRHTANSFRMTTRQHALPWRYGWAAQRAPL